jgi:hypothetical protein
MFEKAAEALDIAPKRNNDTRNLVDSGEIESTSFFGRVPLLKLWELGLAVRNVGVDEG